MNDDNGSDRFARFKRPMQFIRIRLNRNANAEWLLGVLESERNDLYEELGRLRGEGKDEDNEEVVEVMTELRHCIFTLKDVELGLMELVGPDTVLR